MVTDATPKPRHTILEAVVRALKGAATPISCAELHRRIISAGLYEFHAKDPLGVIRGTVRKHMKADGARRVEIVSRDLYALIVNTR